MSKLFNLAKMTTATSGTGTITLGSAVSGFLSFADAGVSDGDVVSYGISDGANSEVGYGTYTAAGTVLARTTVLKSTNADAAIELSGSAVVYITALAENIGDVVGPATNTADNVPQWNGADSKTLKDGLVIVSSTYTPTLFNTTNVDSSTARECRYIRIGNNVYVSGAVTIDPTGAGAVVLGISLPIASTFTALWDCTGTANSSSAAVGDGGRILADTTNARILLNLVAVNTGSNSWTFELSYKIL